VYYRDDAGPHRKKVAATRDQAEQVAARVNSQLASNEPTLLTFTPIGVAELRKQFLDYHEHVLHSSVGTLRRYRSATQHLDDFVATLPKPPQVHEVKVEAFAAYLRRVEVTPNGHANARKRKLLTKGVQYVLETCRTMYTYAVKRRHLPPYAGNPFSELPLDKMKVEDAKPIFVFTADTELKFLKACSAWAFPVHFTLAKTGLRVGELVHLLVEDVDLAGGWRHVRNKVELGWRVPVAPVSSVVVDTNLLVAAGFNPGSDAARVLSAVRAGTLRLVWDEATRREAEYVVGKIPPLVGTDLSDLFLPGGRHDGPTDPHAFGFIPDSADRKFAALAAATGAVLVTNDRHLLDGRPHPGLVVLTPVEFARQAGLR
jgi:predicted nucleic acid-binding protein